MATRKEREKAKGRKNLNSWVSAQAYGRLERHAKRLYYGNITATMEYLLAHPTVQAILSGRKQRNG